MERICERSWACVISGRSTHARQIQTIHAANFGPTGVLNFENGNLHSEVWYAPRTLSPECPLLQANEARLHLAQYFSPQVGCSPADELFPTYGTSPVAAKAGISNDG
jgi:hypothetical protein